MRILGIDPGLRTTGFGVLERHGHKLVYVASGTIKSNGNADLPSRCLLYTSDAADERG